jgi:hypothetical protein
MVAGLVVELLLWLSLVLLGPGRLDYVDLPFIISILIGIVEKEKRLFQVRSGCKSLSLYNGNNVYHVEQQVI